MPHREKADLIAEISSELSTYVAAAPRRVETARPAPVEAGCATPAASPAPEPEPSTTILRH
jgi:hypothetical protein